MVDIMADMGHQGKNRRGTHRLHMLLNVGDMGETHGIRN